MARKVRQIFSSARQELKHAVLPKASPAASATSYKLAYADQDFLLRHELRGVRLQLELLKPELMFKQMNIQATVVIFGSARIPDPVLARQQLKTLQASLGQTPDDTKLIAQIAIAKKILEKGKYYQQACKLGALISRHGKDEQGNPLYVITGGGPGIMEGANRGANASDAKTIGLNIVLPSEQGPNPYVTPELCFQFHYFAVRKMHFLIRAKALVVFPGGYGTLDELFEALTLLQTRKIKLMPIVLIGKSYWKKLLNFDFMAAEGMIDDYDLSLFHYAETAQAAWKIIQMFYQRQVAT